APIDTEVTPHPLTSGIRMGGPRLVPGLQPVVVPDEPGEPTGAVFVWASPATGPEPGGGFPPSLGLALQTGDSYLVVLPLDPGCQLVGVHDHLFDQAEAICAAHSSGEHFDHAGQSDDGFV